jgi:hypothetical protein
MGVTMAAMLDLLRTLGAAVVSFLKTRAALQLQNVAVRHQLVIARRSVPKRLRLTHLDRLIFASLYRQWQAKWSSSLTRLVRPGQLSFETMCTNWPPLISTSFQH